MSNKNSKKNVEFHGKRTFSDHFYNVGLVQFPKVCKKCKKIYYNYSDWFAIDALGEPMVYKQTLLLYFRACHCENTLALSIDFEDILKTAKGAESFTECPELIREFHENFIREIPFWKANSNHPFEKFENFVITTTDKELLSKILKESLGQAQQDQLGSYYHLSLDTVTIAKLYICDTSKSLYDTINNANRHHQKISCGILILTPENIFDYLNILESIYVLNPLFQTILYSEKIASVQSYGLDDNYLNRFSEKDESLKFMMINRLNCYYLNSNNF